MFGGETIQPSTTRRPEQFGEKQPYQSGGQPAGNPFSDRGAVARHRAMTYQLAQSRRAFVGLPQPHQVIAAQQLGRHLGIKPVGFEFRLGARLGDQRVARHSFSHQRPQRQDGSPIARRGLQRHAVCETELAPRRPSF